MSETVYRFRGNQPPTAASRMSILAPETDSNGVAELHLYDPIDSWGGWWGVSAKEFAAALAALSEDTSEIRLYINSPGGEVWEATAIINLLRRHDAHVVAIVDGLAASAASMARRVSALPDCGTTPNFRPVAGLTTSSVCPLSACTHLPPIRLASR